MLRLTMLIRRCESSTLQAAQVRRFPISVLLVLSLAADASADLLAGYEPSEQECLTVTSPGGKDLEVVIADSRHMLDVEATTILVPEQYPAIQDALNVAVSGDVVSVAPGIYNEHVRFESHGVTLRSRVPHAATIDGGGSGHVVVCNPYTATVEGFVITGSGGGFYAGVFTSQATQVIRGNIITGNGGDGISLSSGSVALIERNIITDNDVWQAGIELKTGASATIVNNYIAGNRYGIRCFSAGEVVVANNTITGNVKWNLYFGGTTATVTNNILADAEIGIIFLGPYHVDITYLVSQYLTISHNDVWQNSLYDYYAELGGMPLFITGRFSPLPGTGELSTDPLLLGAEGYHLHSGSPCIDAADNTAVPADTLDLDEDGDTTEPIPFDLEGNSRFHDAPDTPDTGNGIPPIVDMGAYEYQGSCTGAEECDDGLFCTGEEACVLGTCELGTPPCIPLGFCRESDDQCLDCLDDSDCSDGDPCTGTETCAADGTCTVELTEDCNKNDQEDSCDLAEGSSLDCNENSIPDECEMGPPTPAGPPHDARKNRHVSLDPDNVGCVGFQVELVSMRRCSDLLSRACSIDDDCEAAVPGSGTCIEHPDVGTAGPWWVQAPQQEPLGCIPGPCGDEDWFSRVDSVPHFEAWTVRTLHIGDCELIPVATYEVRACAPPDGVICSDPLTIGTIEQPFISPGFRGNYGDVAGPVDAITEEFTPPDGFTNVIDVSAYVNTKQNYGTTNKPQTHPTWVDLHGLGNGQPPQYILNVSDMGQILKAFAGDAWTDDPGNMDPGQCP